MLIPDTWYLTLMLDMLSLDTRYLTPDIWHLTIDMLSLNTWHMLSLSTDTSDLMLWHLTGYYYTWHLYYIIYSRLSLLRGLDMIIILLSDIWYSWAPVLLYFWTPVTGRLLILHSWYYTLDDVCNWIIKDIRLLWIHCGQHYWTIYNKVLNLNRDEGNWWVPI